jgi:PPOX class probable F420-dependent enzyme
MAADNLRQFDKQSYISLETVRKNGTAVQTPVWFAHSGNTFHVHTQAESGKVKRIGNNPRVRINPCDQRGGLKGEWIEGIATLVPQAEHAQVERAFQHKYGLMWTLFNLFGRLRKTQTVKIKITV